MKFIYLISFVILFSQQVLAAPKMLECTFKNKNITSCPASEYTNLVTIVFDTNDLNKSQGFAEFSHTYCTDNFVGETIRVEMQVSTSTITFVDDSTAKKFNDPSYVMNWNVDRKTLKAGYGTSRRAECSLSDVNVSDNQI